MGASKSSEKQQQLEEEEEFADNVATGDLVLLRLTANLDGIELAPTVAAQTQTAIFGDQPAHRRVELPDWDRVGVVLEWGFNDRGKLVPPSQLHNFTGLQPCVAIVYSDCVQVHQLSEILQDSRYTVIAVRRFRPPLHEAVDNSKDPEDVEAGVRPKIDMAEQLSQAVAQIEGKSWTELSAAAVSSSARRHLRHKDKEGNDEISPIQDSSLQMMFKRLRSYTQCLHKDALEAKYVEAQAAGMHVDQLALEEAQGKTGDDKRRGWLSCGRQSNSSVVAPLEEVEAAEAEGDWHSLAKLKVRRRFEDVLEKQQAHLLDIEHSDEDWRQLVSRALGKDIGMDTAMRMQFSICEQWGLTIAEAETAMMLLCGRFDIGAQLSAEVVLHFYRRAGIFDTDVDLGKFWSPTSFDPQNEGSDRLQEVLQPGRKVGKVEVLVHKKKEQHTSVGRLEQRYEACLKTLGITRKDTVIA